MKKNKSLNIILVVLAIFVAGSLYYWYQDQNKPSQLDDFAKCLGTKGIKFYGAFWCPHCQAQKALFGSSKQYLPYVECSTADSKGQTQICIDKGIQSYPTWSYQEVSSTTASTTEVFRAGEKTLQELSDMSSCVLPAGVK